LTPGTPNVLPAMHRARHVVHVPHICRNPNVVARQNASIRTPVPVLRSKPKRHDGHIHPIVITRVPIWIVLTVHKPKRRRSTDRSHKDTGCNSSKRIPEHRRSHSCGCSENVIQKIDVLTKNVDILSKSLEAQFAEFREFLNTTRGSNSDNAKLRLELATANLHNMELRLQVDELQTHLDESSHFHCSSCGYDKCIELKKNKDNVLEVIEKDESKLGACKAALCLSIDKGIYVHVQNCVSAIDIWNKLKSMFEDKGLSRRIVLLKGLTNVRLNDCENMPNYVNK
ncbi:hypothetical protein Bhyg_04237, partial [Pseudolycoriella hygida]